MSVELAAFTVVPSADMKKIRDQARALVDQANFLNGVAETCSRMIEPANSGVAELLSDNADEVDTIARELERMLG